MGLNASVRCRCWEDGLSVPEALRDYLVLDDEDHLGLRVGHAGNEERHRIWEDWGVSCCPHAEMRAASEYIASWAGVGEFRDVLHRAGPEHYPTVLRELPQVNGGVTYADAAERMLAELDAFMSLGALQWRSVLIAMPDGSEVEVVPLGEESISARAGDVEQGVDGDGFFLRSGKRILFRSRRFEQILADIPDDVRQAVVFRALDSPQCTVGLVVLGSPLRGETDRRHRPLYPSLLSVERRPLLAADYADLVDPLRRLCRASIETRNPVRWS
jgi:hypothetical protein